tara:strand:+ start:167 stop:547 length:381 start_codon:yes stop_codon:yes gene_type:complete
MVEFEGSGWRLARNPSRKLFSVLLGGKDWSVEINEEEWISLFRLIMDLLDQYEQLKEQLFEEESLCLEISRQPWWLCLDSDGSIWSLQLIFECHDETSRGFDCFWPPSAAQDVVSAMRKLWDSMND